METSSYDDPMKEVNQSHVTNQSFTSMLNDAYPNHDVTNQQNAFVTSQQPQYVQNQTNETNQTLSTPIRYQVRF